MEKVTITTKGWKAGLHSRIIKDEEVILVQEDDEEARPPRRKLMLDEALLWLLSAGYEAEGMEDGGIAKWEVLTPPSFIEVKRRCTFHRVKKEEA